jgi:hypothetical protein
VLGLSLGNPPYFGSVHFDFEVSTRLYKASVYAVSNPSNRYAIEYISGLTA